MHQSRQSKKELMTSTFVQIKEPALVVIVGQRPFFLLFRLLVAITLPMLVTSHLVKLEGR